MRLLHETPYPALASHRPMLVFILYRQNTLVPPGSDLKAGGVKHREARLVSQW
jgi:hypothetical protein